MDAASRGSRYRAGPTPRMSQLRWAGRRTPPAYAAALADVALAAAARPGRTGPDASATPRIAAAAQLGEARPRRRRVDLPRASRCPGVGDDCLEQVRRLGPGAARARRARATPRRSRPARCAPASRPPVEPTRSATAAAADRRRATAAGAEEPPSPSRRPKTVEELLAELDELVGLTDVKAEIHRQAAVLRVEGLRKEAGLESADHHPAPDLQRQPRHRQDDGRPAGRRHLPRARAALEGPAGRGRPLRAGGRLPRPDRDEDRRGREVRRGRRAVHRRGLLALRRPVRHRGDRHPGQGDGGQARRPGRDRRRLPAADGGLHLRRTPGSRAGSAPPSTSPTTPTTSWSQIFERDGRRRRVRRRRAACSTGCASCSAHVAARADVRQRALRPQRARGRDRPARLAAARGRRAHASSSCARSPPTTSTPAEAVEPARRGRTGRRRRRRRVEHVATPTRRTTRRPT